jgi:spore coat protein A
LEVEPRLYRFRILKGCNARILNLDIGGARMWQIGAEGGLWDKPVPLTRLVLAPAERADILMDFSALAGAILPMKNLEPPKPVSTPAPPRTGHGDPSSPDGQPAGADYCPDGAARTG